MARGLPPPPPVEADWALFLDVDGTLLELAASPGAVRVERPLLELLRRARLSLAGAVALVSGRSLRDLDRLLGVSDWPAAGEHGLEIRDAGGRSVREGGGQMASALAVRDAMAALARRHKGLLLEEKAGSLALHYRRAPRLAGYVHRKVREAVAQAGNGLRITPGNRVIEIGPSGADKGAAVEQLLALPPFAGRRAVFVGDDVTDEDAFAVVNRLRGISVRVGKGRTVAGHRLPGVDAVHRWLDALPPPDEAGPA